MAIENITVPDFGDVQEITVLEIYINAGDTIEEEDPIVSLESEKAVMDIPSPVSGKIHEVLIGEGDTVNSGDIIATIERDGVESATEDSEPAVPEPATPEPAAPPVDSTEPATDETVAEETISHASPSVRSYAREHDVDLSTISGSGPKGRITKQDIDEQRQARPAEDTSNLQSKAQSLPLDDIPTEDFSKFGPVEDVVLGRIQKISGPHLHRSWVSIPHVTHFDEADITDLESFRKQMNEEAVADNIKFSPLVFIIKGVVSTLKEYPLFNCSLLPGGDRVALKRYYNIGIAVDTPGGLVVPVIKNADQKGMREIALELRRLSEEARAGKLAIPDIQGASFTISSLGGIGGTGFTPIVNGPQVAILGLSRNYQKPTWNGEQFIPRLTLPFSLSYDHRVIDGAEAARFCRSLSNSIEDLRRALL